MYVLVNDFIELELEEKNIIYMCISIFIFIVVIYHFIFLGVRKCVVTCIVYFRYKLLVGFFKN